MFSFLLLFCVLILMEAYKLYTYIHMYVYLYILLCLVRKMR